MFYHKAVYKGRLKSIQSASAQADLYRPFSRSEQRVVDEGYVTRTHLVAIAEAARQGRFIISIRNTGVPALSWLEKGAATKPHTILEKTLKADRVPQAYKLAVESSGLQGLAAHWDGNKPVGAFVTREAAANWISNGGPRVEEDAHHNFYIPINFLDPYDPNLQLLKSISGWATNVITGDYDTHDMLVMTGAGGPHSVVSESSEEHFVRDAINMAVSTIDPGHTGGEHLVVQHGPQANYPAFAMHREKLRDQLVPAVAHPSLPLAFCDSQSQWTIVNTQKELEAYYLSHHARIKETWRLSDPLIQFTLLERDKVGLRRPSQKSLREAENIALKNARENRHRRYSEEKAAIEKRRELLVFNRALSDNSHWGKK